MKILRVCVVGLFVREYHLFKRQDFTFSKREQKKSNENKAE